MAKLPKTPDLDRLRALPPAPKTLKAGTRLTRIYRRGGNHPTRWDAFRYYGPTSARFDHQEADELGQPVEQSRGIIYFSSDGPTALAEIFQADRTVDRTRGIPWIVIVELAVDLTLLDLTGNFCVQAGASMELVSGPASYAQNWSRGFYQCYEDIHGLYYPSSMTKQPVIALYERALSLYPFTEPPKFHRALDDLLLIEPLRNACGRIGYDLV